MCRQTISYSNPNWRVNLWLKSVKPAEKKYIIPTQKNADLVFCNNTWEEIDRNVKLLEELVKLLKEDKEKFKKKLAEEKTKNQPNQK